MKLYVCVSHTPTAGTALRVCTSQEVLLAMRPRNNFFHINSQFMAWLLKFGAPLSPK